MNILLTWLTTIIISKSMNFITISRIFKDIYGSGYKINIKRFMEMSSKMNDNNYKIRQFIPLLNIFDSLKMGSDYLTKKDEIINFFFVNDSLEEMNNDEKDSYNNKPTLINALLISEKANEKEEKKEKLLEEQKQKYYKAIRINYLKRGNTHFCLKYKENNNKIIVNGIDVRTDLEKTDDYSEYSNFIFDKIKGIKKYVGLPISKKRFIKILENNNNYIIGKDEEDEENILEEDLKEVVKIINSTYRVHKLNIVWKI